MAFWSNVVGKYSHEPLRQNRWYIFFGNSQLTYSLKEVQKPEYNVSFTEHRLLTQTFKLPGLLKWKPINIKLIATVGDSKTLDDVFEGILRQYGYNSPLDYEFEDISGINETLVTKIDSEKANKYGVDTSKVPKTFKYDKTTKTEIFGRHQQIGFTQQSTTRVKDEENNYDDFTKISIKQIDQNGIVIETWDLYNCFLSSVKYGTLSYENEGFVDINLTIEYDWAVHYDEYYNNLRRNEAERLAQAEAAKITDEINKEIDKKEKEALAQQQREKDYERLRALEASETDLQRIAREGTKEQKEAANAALKELEDRRKQEKDRKEAAEKEAKQQQEQRIKDLEAKKEEEKLQANAAAEKRKKELEAQAEADAQKEVNDLLATNDAKSGKEAQDTAQKNDALIQAEAEKKAAESGKILGLGKTNEERENEIITETEKETDKRYKETQKAEKDFEKKQQEQRDEDERNTKNNAAALDRTYEEQRKLEEEEREKAEAEAEKRRKDEEKRRVKEGEEAQKRQTKSERDAQRDKENKRKQKEKEDAELERRRTEEAKKKASKT